jgi:hypothetical protein
MAGPIYRMFYSRMKEAWYQLSAEERADRRGQPGDEERQRNVGAHVRLQLGSEKWVTWGVEEFPSLEAMQEYARCLAELDWFRYCEAETLLGTKM